MSVSSVQSELESDVAVIKEKTGQLKMDLIGEPSKDQLEVFRTLSNAIHEVADKIERLGTRQLTSKEQAVLVEVQDAVQEAFKKINTFRTKYNISEYRKDIFFLHRLWNALWGALRGTTSVPVDKGAVSKKVTSQISQRVSKLFFESAPRALQPEKKEKAQEGVWGVEGEEGGATVTLWVGNEGTWKTCEGKITEQGFVVGEKKYHSWESAAQSISASATMAISAPRKRAEIVQEAAKYVSKPAKVEEAAKYVSKPAKVEEDAKYVSKPAKVEEDAWYLTPVGDGYTITGRKHNGKQLTITTDGQLNIGGQIFASFEAAGLLQKDAVAEVNRKKLNEAKKTLLTHGVVGHLDDLLNLQGKDAKVFVFTKEYGGVCIAFDGAGIRSDREFAIAEDGTVKIAGIPIEIANLEGNEAVTNAKKIAGQLEQVALDRLATKQDLLGGDIKRVEQWLTHEEREGTFWIEGPPAQAAPLAAPLTAPLTAPQPQPVAAKKLTGGLLRLFSKAVVAGVVAFTTLSQKILGSKFSEKTYQLRYYDNRGRLKTVPITSKQEGFSVGELFPDEIFPTVKELLSKIRGHVGTPKTFEQMMDRVVAKETKAQPIVDGLKNMMGMERDTEKTEKEVSEIFKQAIQTNFENGSKMMYLVWKDGEQKYHVSVKSPNQDDVTKFDLDVVTKPGRIILTGQNATGTQINREITDVTGLPQALHVAQNLSSEMAIADPNEWDAQLMSKMKRWGQLTQLCYPEKGSRELSTSSFGTIVTTIGSENAKGAYVPVLHANTVEIKKWDGSIITVILPKTDGESLKVGNEEFPDWGKLLKAKVGDHSITPSALTHMAEGHAKAVTQLQGHRSYRSDDGGVEFGRIVDTMKSDLDPPQQMWLLRDTGQVGLFRWIGAKAGLLAPPEQHFVATFWEGGKKTEHPIELVFHNGEWVYKSAAKEEKSLETLLKKLDLPEGFDVTTLNRRMATFTKQANQIEGKGFFGGHQFYEGVVLDEAKLYKALKSASKTATSTVCCIYKDGGGHYKLAVSAEGKEPTISTILITSQTGEVVLQRDGAGYKYKDFDTFRKTRMCDTISKAEAERQAKQEAVGAKPVPAPAAPSVVAVEKEEKVVSAPVAPVGVAEMGEEGGIATIPQWLGQGIRKVVGPGEKADKGKYTELVGEAGKQEKSSLFALVPLKGSESGYSEEGQRFHLWVKALGEGTIPLLTGPTGATALTGNLPAAELFLLYALCVSGNVMRAGSDNQKQARTIISEALKSRLKGYPEERETLVKSVGMRAQEYKKILGSRGWKQVCSLLGIKE